MKMRFLHIMISLSIIGLYPLYGKDKDVYSLKIEEGPLFNALVQIEEITSFSFTYQTSLVENKIVSTHIFASKNLDEILNDLLTPYELEWICYNNLIILKKSKVPELFRTRFNLINIQSNIPLTYFPGFLKGSGKEFVSNRDGEVLLILKKEQLDDTLVFNSKGFQSKEIPVRTIFSSTNTRISLVPIPIKIPQDDSMGFNRIGMGSDKADESLLIGLYNQQVALKIICPGYGYQLKKVRFFITGKGCPEMPLRVHVYGMNQSSGHPAEELLKYPVLIKPSQKKGWIEVDLQPQKVMIPTGTCFVALEGIFPDDYDYYLRKCPYFPEEYNRNNTKLTGQCLGMTYSKDVKNLTWHYSLSHNWFQTSSKNLNVMILADFGFPENSEGYQPASIKNNEK